MEQKLSTKIIFQVLFWGALWGIVEATLGTILHLPAFDAPGIYLCSSTIIIPIAYCLMANCYKRTGSFYSVYLMGVLAGVIKLTTAFIVGFINRVYMPAIYIVVEALAMGTVLAVFKPKNVLSLKTFASVVVANTVYQFMYLVIRIADGGQNVFASLEAWRSGAEKYILSINFVACFYTLAIGGAVYGLLKLAEKKEWNLKFSLDKIIYSPIAASISVGLALVLTITLKLL